LGNPPFRIVVPSVFRNVHGDRNSIIASDDPGRNSIQLLSGPLTQETGSDYLKERCPADLKTMAARGDLQKFADRNDIDNPSTIVFSFTARYVSANNANASGCYFSWHETGQPLDHYEVYVVYRSDESAPWQWARMHLRAEKPTHVLVREDYVQMRDSLLASAGIPRPKN
jgi:hypothetical protein